MWGPLSHSLSQLDRPALNFVKGEERNINPGHCQMEAVKQLAVGKLMKLLSYRTARMFHPNLADSKNYFIKTEKVRLFYYKKDMSYSKFNEKLYCYPQRQHDRPQGTPVI